MLSMTGHGEAHRQNDQVSVRVEIRAVNNRYFKLSLRTSDGFGSLEPRIEQFVRARVRRGTVQMQLRVEFLTGETAAINEDLLVDYYRKLEQVHHRLGLKNPMQFEQLLLLPGVIQDERLNSDDVTIHWPVLEESLDSALASLNEMRQREGTAMGEDLRSNCGLIGEQLVAIEARTPHVVSAHRDRLLERVNRLLAEQEVTLETSDVVREMGILADRIDVAEETVRLRSHLDQFDATLKSDESLGRKLDFLIQEMFRETNTIGSKANDAEIAHHVVEIKSGIERMREMIQNIE